jgi:predicted DNA-binding protein
MAKQRTIRVPASTLLRDSERQTTSMSLPAAVHLRLDELVEQAGAANASRAEIVAMLITEAEDNAAALARRVLDYRELKVGDVLKAPDGQDVVVPIHGPGRRSRRPA